MTMAGGWGKKDVNFFTPRDTYMWESSWPSGAVYDEVHKTPAYQAATEKHPEMDELMKTEVYNRYVEVTAARSAKQFVVARASSSTIGSSVC